MTRVNLRSFGLRSDEILDVVKGLIGASFDEEKLRSHPHGFFADQVDVSPSHSGHAGMLSGTPAEPQQLQCMFHRRLSLHMAADER